MNDKVEEIINHPLFIPAVVGLTGFASGLGLGFFLGKRKYDVFVKPDAPHEVAEIDLHTEEDEVPLQATEPPTPVVIDEKVAREKGIIKVDSLADLSPSMVSGETEEETEVVEEVTEVTEVTEESTEEEPTGAEDGIEWDWDAELGKRLSTEPYILHLEEYEAQELGFTQYALTFYSMDEILVDSDNVPVFNHSDTVGELKFGHGSGQVDVVYIRNHERKAEYEITRLDQSFAMEIHGLEVENNERIKDLRHGKLMRFRQD